MVHMVIIAVNFIVAIYISTSLVAGGWSFYESNIQKKKNTQCNPASNKVNVDFNVKHKLWPNLFSSWDFKHGETVQGFQEMFKLIWSNQHPADCSNVKFAIWNGFNSGFGSEFHELARSLAVAMNNKRVLIARTSFNYEMKSHVAFQVDNEFCRHQNATNLECYFEPWSSCTMMDAIGRPTEENFLHRLSQDVNSSDKVIDLRNPSGDIAPVSFREYLCSIPFGVDTVPHLFNAAASAFFLRPNAATLAMIRSYQTETTYGKFDVERDQCVSVYLRRGDKHAEMKIIEDETVFFNASVLAWKYIQSRYSRMSKQRGTMYFASEDPIALEKAIAWGKNNDWKILYTNLFDRSKVSAWLNYSAQQQLLHKSQQVHHELEYFSMILNIDHHLKCSAFVCTLSSNFCRIIEELKITVANKLDKQFYECHADDGVTVY